MIRAGGFFRVARLRYDIGSGFFWVPPAIVAMGLRTEWERHLAVFCYFGGRDGLTHSLACLLACSLAHSFTHSFTHWEGSSYRICLFCSALTTCHWQWGSVLGDGSNKVRHPQAYLQLPVRGGGVGGRQGDVWRLLRCGRGNVERLDEHTI